MRPEFRIMCDVDGVIADFSTQFICHLRAKRDLGHGVSVEDITAYRMTDNIPGLRAEMIPEIINDPLFILDMPTYEYSLGFILSLESFGEVNFVTARREGVGEETRAWFQANFGYRHPHIVHTHDKVGWCRAHNVYLAVEDAPHHALEIANAGIPVILVDRPYNRQVTHPKITRVRPGAWEAWYSALTRSYFWYKQSAGERVPDKDTMYWHYHRGHFGNNSGNFDTLEEAVQSPRLVGMRYKPLGMGGSRFDGSVPPGELVERVKEWKAAGFDVARIQYSMMIPDEDICFQAEVQRSPEYFWVKYSLTIGEHFRQAFRINTCNASGLKAKLLLQHYMEPADWDDLQEIFDRWPSAVVELTCLRKPFGSCARRNTIFWEVRDY